MISSMIRSSRRSPVLNAVGANALAFLLLSLYGCSGDGTLSIDDAVTTESTEIERVARNYSRLRLVTKTPVEVDPQLAMLCIGIQQVHVDEARKRAGPHAHTSIRIFMNDAADATFRQSAPEYPVGSVIVKEKRGLEYNVDMSKPQKATTQDGVGGMIKRAPGYDPARGDWEYFYFADASKIESGRISTCIECHRGAAATDYVFGDWAGRK